jgi:hypothetical protein
MRVSAWRFGVAVLTLAAVVAGCSKEPPGGIPATGGADPDSEAAVRTRFADVQAAIRAKDGDKLWDLLSLKSQADAEKEAAGVRAAYEQAGAGERATLEKDLGVPAADLAKLTGAGFLKSKLFHDRRGDMADGTVTRVTAQADSATVYFDEPDGDKEKLVFVREAGQWKAWMAIPRVKRP